MTKHLDIVEIKSITNILSRTDRKMKVIKAQRFFTECTSN